MRFRSIMLCASLLLLSACTERGSGPVLATGERYVTGLDVTAGYQLGVGDRIKMIVFGEPTLSGEFGVGAAGTIALPLIGELPATGRTVSDIAAEARTRFADGYLRDPKVSAEVSVYRPFYILGEVETPGQYPFVVGMTAYNAVATAKGFTPRANRDVVQIRRQGDAAESTYRLTPELHVYPGDTVRVTERYF